jgi:hypothetical protein
VQFYVFLPEFLASRGAETGEDSPYYTWRNYLISNTVGIFGVRIPLILDWGRHQFPGSGCSQYMFRLTNATARPGWLHVQYETPRAQIYDGHRRTGQS